MLYFSTVGPGFSTATGYAAYVKIKESAAKTEFCSAR